MTRSTASRLVDDLVAGGVLAELEPPAGPGPGRPATPLVAGRRLAGLGLQVNATFIAARVVNLRGEVIGEQVVYDDLVGSAPEITLARLAEVALSALGQVPSAVSVVGASLALPGVVSVKSGRLLLAPNLGWSDLDAGPLTESLLGTGLSVRIGNEADLAALAVAEAAPGRPGPHADFIYLSGEIGIGGAAVLDGQLFPGRHGWAGEIGHVCVNPDGPSCPCGSTGCLERYAGREAIFTAAGLVTGATADDLVGLVLAGNESARAAISQAARALGIALSGAINLLDIPTVVLGGHLGQIADVLMPELERHLTARVLSARWVQPSLARVEGDLAPGATGGAIAELSAVLANPAGWLG